VNYHNSAGVPAIDFHASTHAQSLTNLCIILNNNPISYLYHSCGSCSSKRVNLEEKYRLGEGEAGSRVCTACFVHKYECSSADLNTDINAKANGGKQSAQDHRENQENAGINGSRAGVAASSAAAGVGTNAKLSNTRPILSERPAIVASSEPDERSAFSPEVTGVAIPAGDLEAPTPDPKSVPTVGAVAVSRSRTSSISSNTSTTNITTNPEIIPKGILKMPQAAPALIIPQEVQVQPVELLPSCQSPMSALLDGLNGRWDRSDDGISTPGSVTSMMNYSATNTAVTTPERMHGGPGSLAAVTPTTQAGEKYFYTPSHTNTCSDASYMMAGSASVLRREQLAAHNAKLNIEVCREVDATSDMMYSPLQSSPASSSMVTLTPSPLPNTQSHAL